MRTRARIVGCLCLLAGLGTVLAAPCAFAAPSALPFAIEPGSFHIVSSTGQAGAHENLTTTFELAHTGAGSTYKTDNDSRTVVVNLPAGFTASNTAVPTCTIGQLVGNITLGGSGNGECPVASQVGTISLTAFVVGTSQTPAPARYTVPLYNMQVTSYGVAAELGFNLFGNIVQTLPVRVRPGDLGLTVTTPQIEPKSESHAVSVTVWGLPASSEHDAERGVECTTANEPECTTHGHPLGGESAGIPVKPFLSMPTSCGSFEASIEANSWEHPEEWSKATTDLGPVGECERVPFEPSIVVSPTTTSAESPSGLEVSLQVPQTWEQPETLASSNLDDATVTLPAGYTINPSAGAGLQGCSPVQYEAETSSAPPGTGCPEEAKLGTVKIETPVLGEPIEGNIYIATPYENPFDSLLALYVVAKDPQRGIIVKVAGKVEPNPVTGQLTSTFQDNPEQPFSSFKLRFIQSATSPLVSPALCGSYAAEASLSPWSEPLEPRMLQSPAFSIVSGVGGGPCPSGGTPSFAPRVISGTSDNSAGSYSPFYLRIDRQDGEQEITKFSTTLPPGLSGNLSGIPFCPDSTIEAARHVTGAQEEASPSCPQLSEIGHSITEAGVGTVLAQAPGKIYLAGPYNGAPLSIVSITSAKVGPFDLGTVVIRFALDINPTTAQVEVSGAQSDPIPHIIDGIVVHVRNIRVYMDREKFILNPTNCNRMSIAETIDGAGTDPANPADQVPVNVTAPFQAADCSSLKFEPKFSVSTSAKTSRADGASLTAKLTVPGALGTQANISGVKVELPEQLPSRLPTLQKACTAEQFEKNPAGCPPASIIGHARAITPILPVPLEGPAYFVSHGGEGWPSLVVVLQGYGVTIDLTGTTFISKAGVTSTTFKTVPDQPVTSFELTLPEGPYSALTALGNLCSATNTVTLKKKVTVKVHGRRKTITRKVKETKLATLQMPTEFVAQNGAEIHQDTPITVTGCPKKAVHAKSARHKAKGGKKGGR
jgi:hypothetical protein